MLYASEWGKRGWRTLYCVKKMTVFWDVASCSLVEDSLSILASAKTWNLSCTVLVTLIFLLEKYLLRNFIQEYRESYKDEVERIILSEDYKQWTSLKFSFPLVNFSQIGDKIRVIRENTLTSYLRRGLKGVITISLFSQVGLWDLRNWKRCLVCLHYVIHVNIFKHDEWVR
jgi:hypothetical protein